MLTIAKFGEFQKAQSATQQALEWVQHEGASGRGGETLSLSIAHSSIKLTIAGQYSEGGKNYWESPAVLNSAILRVIARNRRQIYDEAVALLKADELAKLAAAKDEIAQITAAIESAAA